MKSIILALALAFSAVAIGAQTNTVTNGGTGVLTVKKTPKKQKMKKRYGSYMISNGSTGVMRVDKNSGVSREAVKAEARRANKAGTIPSGEK